MNKGALFGGIAFLVLAAVLGVLNLTLPADKLMFNVGDKNMPWAGAALSAVAGVVLMSIAVVARPRGGAQPAETEKVLSPEKAALNKRLESIGWGCFLIMLGGYWLIPHTVIARGFWSIGVGLIMLGLNVARYYYHIRMSGFTTFLGVLSLLGGILQLLGWEEIEGAFLLIILGAFLLVKPWFDKRQLFGKAEEA